MKAEIITIGDEILIGQIVDTNSAWIATQFNLAGIEIYQITSVHDDRQHILTALEEAGKRADLVMLTGGLGPTKDDITKQTLCEFFGSKLIFHEPTYEHIVERFRARNISMNRLNHDQALVPDNCTVLHNALGSAPGMWFEKDGKIYVSVAGVPFEMMYLVENEIIPKLRKTGRTKAIYHKTVLTQGLPESMLAERIENWELSLPQNIKLAYLPNPMSVRLRLSASGKDENMLIKQVESEIEKLKGIISEIIYGYDNETLAEVIGRKLIEDKKTLAVAESCTGGYVSSQITFVPGISTCYKGSVTSYSNQIKIKALGVNPQSLEKYGAVSEQVAMEMAQGILAQFEVDYAISTTGIAGPDGGTPEKPVGTVWIAVASKEKCVARLFTFVSDKRERTIIRSGQSALMLMWHFLNHRL